MALISVPLISGTSIGNHHKGGETTMVGVTVSDIIYTNLTIWKLLNTIPIVGGPVSAIPLGFTPVG